MTRGIGGHGVAGVLRNGPGPAVMLRAELDALPVAEHTGLPYASTATGRTSDGREVPVMHACGHDVHLACAAGAASALADDRDAWRGTVLVVGQAAEETLHSPEFRPQVGATLRTGIAALHAAALASLGRP
ncbi:hypothetical protein TR51_03090 [Kitasatospora griseola]|uniref:Amidohydrolase n=1 Tax=Kitasatospora griseola TaxID=2064 RepID=A0A0D0PVQ1_KITGR|nr:hypothetical protein TR51_03090 [Kitasatospora griseola]